MIRAFLPKTRGFTLTEVLVVTLIVGIIFLAGIAAFVPAMEFFVKERSRAQMVRELRLALDYINKDGMGSRAAYVLPNNMVQFRTGSATFVIYKVNGTSLLRDIGGFGGVVATSTITELLDTNNLPVYTKSGNNFVTAAITLKDPRTGIIIRQVDGAMLRCSRR